MIELVIEGVERSLKVCEIHHPAQSGVDIAADMEFDPEGVSVQAGALVTLWDIGQPMGGFQCECLEYFHREIVRAAAWKVLIRSEFHRQ